MIGPKARPIQASVVIPSSADEIAGHPFGHLSDGQAVKIYTLRNRRGMEARIATYGGIVTSLTAPDRAGHYADVVLGYDNLAGYLKDSPYFGALIGRYGNRIAGGRFVLGGIAYTLAINNGQNSLHGGRVGFDKVVWWVDIARLTMQGPRLTLRYLSHHGEEGYPGNLQVNATYRLSDDNALWLEYAASTDRDTIVNLTQHSYFNLRGNEHRGDILGHIVTIPAERFIPVDATLIPTGELRSVAGTPFDFRTPTAIGARSGDPDEQLRLGKGYDHNWVIDGPSGTLRMDARIYEPTTGRVLEVWSNQPGLQFYTGNMLDGTITGKGGWTYGPRSGFCMEPQHFPDSPNRPEFPSTELKAGEVYHSVIVYRFTTH
jgi:aldose 1-epimerase